MALAVADMKTGKDGRELIAHGSTLFPAACYWDDLTCSQVPWHWHEELEVMVVAQGRAVMATDSGQYLLEEGDGVFVNGGVLHGAWSAEGQALCRCFSIVFHPRLPGGSMDSVFWQKYLHPLLQNRRLKGMRLDCREDWAKEGIRAVEQAWENCVWETDGYEFAVRENLSRLIFLLTRHCPAREALPAEKELRDGERIKQMLQYIQEHFAEELDTRQIARSAMISQSECLRCFHSTIGTTPIQYLKQYRVERAAELLCTGLKISEVGARCGFQEMSYFARAFRERKGCTPSEYRKKHRL